MPLAAEGENGKMPIAEPYTAPSFTPYQLGVPNSLSIAVLTIISFCLPLTFTPLALSPWFLQAFDTYIN